MHDACAFIQVSPHYYPYLCNKKKTMKLFFCTICLICMFSCRTVKRTSAVTHYTHLAVSDSSVSDSSSVSLSTTVSAFTANSDITAIVEEDVIFYDTLGRVSSQAHRRIDYGSTSSLASSSASSDSSAIEVTSSSVTDSLSSVQDAQDSVTDKRPSLSATVFQLGLQALFVFIVYLAILYLKRKFLSK